MSIAHDFTMDNGFAGSPDTTGSPVPQNGQSRTLHRIADARRRQGVSLRSVARRLNKSAEQVRRLEEPTSDMLVSELYEWQRALEVPIVDLLLDCQAPLSEPVLTRARLLQDHENRPRHPGSRPSVCRSNGWRRCSSSS